MSVMLKKIAVHMELNKAMLVIAKRDGRKMLKANVKLAIQQKAMLIKVALVTKI